MYSRDTFRDCCCCFAMANSSAARDALRECEEMSLLIEINSDHLERLRNNSSRSGGGGGQPVSELTRQEIRTMEGKLVKHFSKQARHSARIVTPQSKMIGSHLVVTGG